ncbi:MAG TPA: molybdopterin-guanine dinucleotide biosynthesis protein B, partial [Gammaproteobacteria bacterium]|nr:molybdopterin-guanine dinucleotide biosynthesis protein B [Gammaproteobacteria bacterium]
MLTRSTPLLGFVAFSGTGKTTLLRQLIPLLKARGLKIGLIKHAHHRFDIDIPGKDSYELRKAGADRVLVASQQRWAMVSETPQQDGDPALADMLAHIDKDDLDLILVEGFKHARFPKLEL